MANVFYIQCVPALKRLAEIFQKITVPTYVIACGVQADSFDKHRFALSVYDKGLKASRGMRRIAHGLIRR